MKNGVWSRRAIIQQGVLVAGAALLPRGLSAQQGIAPAVVKTGVGVLRGEAGGGVRVFRGVPYAEPPVGPLRFRPAEKKRPWSEVRDATGFSASPVQSGEPGVKHSEDCLYLNVWTPVAGGSHGKGPWPVFVWIHGGGFTGGHAFEAMYDGSEFAREGVVVVTVGYRLGVFGFLDWEPLLGAAYAGTANNALSDKYEDTAITGFIGTHQPAIWMGDYGYVTLMPEVGGLKDAMTPPEGDMTRRWYDRVAHTPYEARGGLPGRRLRSRGRRRRAR